MVVLVVVVALQLGSIATCIFVGPGVYQYFAKICWYILVYTAYTSIKRYEYEYEISVLPYPLNILIPKFYVGLYWARGEMF